MAAAKKKASSSVTRVEARYEISNESEGLSLGDISTFLDEHFDVYDDNQQTIKVVSATGAGGLLLSLMFSINDPDE